MTYAISSNTQYYGGYESGRNRMKYNGTNRDKNKDISIKNTYDVTPRRIREESRPWRKKVEDGGGSDDTSMGNLDITGGSSDSNGLSDEKEETNNNQHRVRKSTASELGSLIVNWNE